MLRFLHAGDLHLGSSFSAFSPAVSARRRERQLSALEDLFARARDAGAQMILLAGDTFDTPVPDADTAERFFAVLAAQDVPVVIAAGNHDPARAGSVWKTHRLPPNVFLFDTPSLSHFDFPELGAAVYGFGFAAESCPAPTLCERGELPADRISLLLAHTDLNLPLSPYAPIGTGQLAASGFAYAALGHIHRPPAPQRNGDTLTAYSGFFAARGFDEPGEGQALLVSLDHGRADIEVLPSAADRFDICDLDCAGLLSGDEVRERLREYIDRGAWSADSALRVRLVGQVGIACHPSPAALAALGGHLALFDVVDLTVPIYDAAYLEKDPTLRGAFYRALLPHLTGADEGQRTLAAEALRLGLTALSGREV